MGKINVVRPDGTVVSVDEETYNAAQGKAGTAESVGGERSRTKEAQNEERNSGPLASVQSFLSGLAGNTPGPATIGILEATNDDDNLPPEWGPEFNHSAQAKWSRFISDNKGPNVAGEIVSLLVPGGQASLANKVGAKVGEKVLGAAGKGVATKGADRAAKLASRGTAGATLGVTSYATHTTIAGDPLTIEGAVEAAGIGAVLDIGIGMLGDKVVGTASKLRKKAADTKSLAERGEKALADKTLFEAAQPVYDEARTAYTSTVGTVKRVKGEQDAYDRALRNHTGFINSNNRFKGAVAKMEGVLNTVTKRPGFRQEVERGITVEADEIVERSVGAVDEAAPAGALEDISTSRLGGTVDEAVPTQLDATITTNTPQYSRIKEFRGRISDVYKKYDGGWRSNGPGRWVRDPRVPADPQGAFDDLVSLNDDIRSWWPKASGKLTDLPLPVSTPRALDAVALPKTLKDFAAMRGETVQQLARTADDATLGAFERMAVDVGESLKASKQETLVSLHARLKSVYKDLDDVAESLTVATKQADSGLGGWIRKFARGAAGLSLGRVANTFMGGGWRGAAAQVAASNAARSTMGAIEDGMLGTVMVQSKESVRNKVRGLIGKYGGRAGSGITKAAPVTAFLSQSFPSGKEDPEPDIRKAAANRINEIAAASVTAPDALFLAVENMLGHPADLGWKVHNQILNGLNTLMEAMPKDSGIDQKMGASNWLPAYEEAIQLAHVSEAVLAPEQSIDRILSGGGHPAAVDALWATWPAMMREAATELMHTDTSGLTFEQASEFSTLFRVPLTPFDEPDIAIALQGMYLPKPDEGQESGQQQSSNPAGRPPAVSNSVAGSSVAAHLS